MYKCSSTVTVERLETELASQLHALRTEIEESGVSLGTTTKFYSSVLIPKDVSYFRMEREQVLHKGLKVAGVRPVTSQAEVAEKELESCQGREYPSESLPLLLHQFFADRVYQLAQCKYQLMLRWRRFCRHSVVLEQLYLFYKAQIIHLTNEFGDAVQRAHRLSICKEKVLSDVGSSSSSVVTQEDVVIYLQWLISRLHSVKTVHHFLHLLHYLPASERKEANPSESNSLNHETSGTFEVVSDVPTHSVKLGEFKAQLQHLISHFQIHFNTEGIRTSADEMELFSMVSQKFRTIFKRQEVMKTFLQYDSTEAINKMWGRKSPNMALIKEVNWIPHIQLKPRRDPWQQKQMTKLKQQRNIDKLLQMHSRFLEESDLFQVTEILKQHAALVCKPKPVEALSVSSQPTVAYSISQIWRSVYSTENLSQESRAKPCASSCQSNQRGTQKKNKTSSFTSNAQLLGLDEGMNGGAEDAATTGGAFMSLLFLRHLRMRELKRSCLSMLNYMRSVERSLTFDTAGLVLVGGELSSTADEFCWMNAARGGSGSAAGLGSHHYIYNTPADYKVHLSEFMEFPEVENLHDFYSTEGIYIHIQDQKGFYIVYDVALKDLEELEQTLVLMASHYIQRSRERGTSDVSHTSESALNASDIDHSAVISDMWTCEAAFLEHKIQLLNCYFEAYQHITDPEERVRLAQVITDIMHRRPRLDLSTGYFVQGYRAEMVCLQSHQQLIKLVLNCQIDNQRQYLQRIWRGGHEGTPSDYGLPPNYVPKQLVSIGGSSPALKSVFLLEIHPSLALASQVYHSLDQAHSELCQLHRARAGSQRVSLEQKLLKQALHHWNTLTAPGASFGSQIQRDLFSEVFFDDPVLVRGVGEAFVRSAEEQQRKQGRERQQFVVETFSVLLELVSLRHRITESASETEHLSKMYKSIAQEMGFDEYHLYVRPVQFEFAVQHDKVEERPLFVTALLQENRNMDRFCPPNLPLSIQELDENQIVKFSFRTEEAVIHLMNQSSLENLQVVLACQVSQKNALIGSIKQTFLCYWAEHFSPTSEMVTDCSGIPQHSQELSTLALRKGVKDGRDRLAEAFVSIQLEKAVLRDEMLNSFTKKRELMSGLMSNPEEVAKIKRKLVIEFCHKFSLRVTQSCVRGQIIALCYSLKSLLDEVPDICHGHFVLGKANESKSELDSQQGLCDDPRTFQARPRQLLSTDGRTLLNVWFIPHHTEVLTMYRTVEEMACHKALQYTLEIMSALHDIIYYLVSFARLGNPGTCLSSRHSHRLTADWGGSESIGAELRELRQQIDSLPDPRDPQAVACLLQLHREVLFLRFDTAVRYMIRDAFLSSGNISSYQSVTDNMSHALPLLSDSLRGCIQQPVLPMPQPMEPRSPKTQMMYPWRCFLACHGSHPLHIWDVLPIEHCMQLCLSGLNDGSRTEANGAMLGVSLLMDDMLSSGRDATPVQLQCKCGTNCTAEPDRVDSEDDHSDDGDQNTEDRTVFPSLQNPIQILSTMRGFLLLWKQLEVFKESWARRQLGVEQISTLLLYKRFTKLYREEIHIPSMRDLAQHLGKEQEYEALLSVHQPVLAPPGAAEVDVKTWQLHMLLEATECDMIRAVQRRLAAELTLVMSERARQDTGLPTEIWKRPSMTHCLSPESPQVVEHFIQQLMGNAEETGEQVTFSRLHLQQCVTALACAVLNRERRSFLLYSQFYEHILQQQNLLLYRKEQDVKELEDSAVQRKYPYSKVAELCCELMTEVTALRARLCQAEEERKVLDRQLSLQHRQSYDSLVRQLFSICLQLKSRLDEYHFRMENDVVQLVSTIRGEGVDKMTKLRAKFGALKDDKPLTEMLSEKKELEDLYAENRQLAGRLCKSTALNRWKKAVRMGKLQRELLQWKQREMSCKTDMLRLKMTAEEESFVLKQELDALRDAMVQCHNENNQMKRKISKQNQKLQEVEHQLVQEAHSRQDIESLRMLSLEQLQEDIGDRERQVRVLSAQLERQSRDSHLWQQRSHKEIKQVRSRLQQERGLKLQAFQQVDKLQSQIHSVEMAHSKCISPPGWSRTASPSKGLRNSSSDLSKKNLSRPNIPDGSSASKRESETQRFERPKTGHRRLRMEEMASEPLLPSLTDGHSSRPYITDQRLRLGHQ